MAELTHREALKETLQDQANIVRTTHKILAQMVHHPARKAPLELLYRFSNTLEYTTQVYEGFVLRQVDYKNVLH